MNIEPASVFALEMANTDLRRENADLRYQRDYWKDQAATKQKHIDELDRMVAEELSVNADLRKQLAKK